MNQRPNLKTPSEKVVPLLRRDQNIDEIDSPLMGQSLYRISPKCGNLQGTEIAAIHNDRNLALNYIAKRRVESSQFSEVRRVQCEVEAGVLVLRGKVSSFYLKQLAQEAVRSIEGIQGIANHVVVAYPPPRQTFQPDEADWQCQDGHPSGRCQ
jgi:hypothetical protein